MGELLSVWLLLQYAAENIALFSGGLFAGAAIYISLTEQPPRTRLSLTDILALSRTNSRRTRVVLASLACIAGGAGVIAAALGASHAWLAGGVLHAAAVVLLLSQGVRITAELESLGSDREYESLGRRLLERQALHFSLLSLIGLAALALYILKP